MEVKTQSRLQKLLDGWQAGAIVVAVAILCTLVVVPRPVAIDEIPLPRVNLRVVSERSQLDAARARSLEKQRPDYDVRALGEALRQYGASDADSDTQLGSRNLQRIGEVLRDALSHGPEAVLSLRAYQMTVFLRELQVYEATGKESVELRELGGGIIALLKRSQWMHGDGAGYRIVPDRTVLEILFRKRWNEVTGLKEPPFALSLDEERAAFAFMLTHPIVSANTPADPSSQCRSANGYLLRKVGELAAIDPDYPGELARGMILLRLGRPKDAIDVLAARLEGHPDGPYTMLTRNALRQAQERLAH
jgi:hypothetical protein